MRERRDAAGVVNAREHLFGRRADARHERRPAGRQPALERLGDVRHVPAVDQRARDPRPADGLASNRSSPGCRIGVRVEHDAVRASRVDHLAHAIDAALALLGEKRLQRRRVGVDEVAEHVDVGAVDDGRDLDAGDELDAARARRPRPPRRQPADRVVIGDGQHA